MKSLQHVAAVAALFLASAAAQASQAFDYSYALYDGPTVSGTFTGDVNGNLITNLSGITVNLDGASLGSYVSGSHRENGAWVDGAPVASLNGLGNNFLFSLNGGAYFYAIPWSNLVTTDAAQVRKADGSYVDYFNGHYNAASWHVTAVPEPEMAAMLLAGLGLVGWMARRKQRTGR